MEQPENLRKKLFNGALDSDNILNLILDNIDQAIVVVNNRLEILYYNKTASEGILEMFGEPIYYGMNLWKFLPEKKYEAARRIRKKLDSGQQVSAILKLNHHNGGIHWFNYHGIPVMDEKENIEYIIVTCVDVTQLKNIEQKIRISEANYRSIVQSQSELICKFRLDGSISFVNNAYCEFFNITQEEILGSNFYERIPKILRDKVRKDIMKLSPINPKLNYIEKIKGDNDQIRWISGSNTAFFDANGDIQEIQMVGKDITEQQRIQDELMNAKEAAEEAGRIRSIFLANISHEIRTPLNGILGFSSILKSNFYKNKSINEYCTLIEESGQRLLQVMDDILEISAIGSSKHLLHNSNVYLPTIIEDLCEYLRCITKEINKKDIRIRKHVPVDGPNYFFIDGVRLYQVFMKLLNNAIKFTYDGEVEFGYYQSRYDTIRFFVRDTGIGIAEDKRDLIFELFRQADESLTRNFGGNGIGLTLAKTLVEDMGGQLELESIVGKGSTFYFDLPLSIPFLDAKIPFVTQEVNKKYKWEGKKILIVEDTYINYSLFKEFLKPTHAAIIPAHNGQEALNLVVENPDIDLVLLDIRLPDISGYEIARRMKKTNPGIPIIAQTAFSSDSGQKEAFEAGCEGFLIKPITKDTLLDSIDSLFRKKHHR